MEEEDEEVAIGENPSIRVGHIKKRALKNKALSVSFNEKDLNDYVAGFHKRKKKRRKEAQHLQYEAERRKRIEKRKQRKLERDFVQSGGAPSTTDKGPNEGTEEEDEHDESDPIASVSGTTMYDTGDVKVMVTTSEISREEEELPSEIPEADAPRSIGGPKLKKNIIPVKKKPLKRVGKRRSGPKPQSKREKRKGKKKTLKR